MDQETSQVEESAVDVEAFRTGAVCVPPLPLFTRVLNLDRVFFPAVDSEASKQADRQASHCCHQQLIHHTR